MEATTGRGAGSRASAAAGAPLTDMWPCQVCCTGAAARRSDSEAHLSAQRPQAGQEARVPQAHADPSRAGHRLAAPAPWPIPVVRLIRRIHDRTTFAALRAAGSRGTAGGVTVTFLADGSPAPRVAFAVPKRAGTAVLRNRTRRRARAWLEQCNELRAGAYLVRLDAPAASAATSQLATDLAGAVRAAHARAAAQVREVR